MKKFYILAIGLILSNSVRSQSYVPLVIDSLYNWGWGVGFHNDTIISEYWSGFSYDSKDTLIQRRVPASRFNYSYGIDTVYSLTEQLGADNNWNVFGRTATAYDDEKIITKLTQRYQNNDFENSALHTYYYDGSSLDTLLLLQHWNNGAWTDFYKKEKTFDVNGNNTEEAEYYVDANGELDYDRGKLFYYDDVNHLIEEIRINSSVNGTYFTGKTNWAYGNDDRLDTLRRCNYSGDICKKVAMATYDYSPQDTIITNRFYEDDDEWEYFGKELKFAGPEMFSSKPDSVIFYRYYAGSLAHTPVVRRYLHYEDLGNDMIYFKDEEYNYFSASDEWVLVRLVEEWYHVKMTVGVDNATNDNEYISTFPNPCRAGQYLTIKEELTNKESGEILIFDMQGRLVSRNDLSQSSLQAPMKKGVYTILIREKGRLIGVAKQVVIE